MNNNFTENLQKTAKSVHFPAEAKTRIKTSLVRTMELHPSKKRSSVFSFMHQLLSGRTAIVAMALAVLVIGGAGTAYAANSTLPGDVLYPVKIRINEKLQVYLADSAEAKSELQLELIDRRMDEGVQLAAQGRLDAHTLELLDSLVVKYKADIEQTVSSLDEQQRMAIMAVVSEKLAAILNVHQQILEKYTDDVDNNRFRENLQHKFEANAKARNEANAKFTGEQGKTSHFQAASENKINSSAKILAVTEQYLEKKTGNEFTEASQKSALAQLTLAKSKLEQARAAFAKGDYRNAFDLAGDAVQLSHEAKTVLRLGSQLKTDVTVKENSNTNSATSKVIEEVKNVPGGQSSVRVETKGNGDVKTEIIQEVRQGQSSSSIHNSVRGNSSN